MINGILRAMLLITTRKSAPLTSLLLPPALNPSPLYAKIELSLISLLIKSIAGIGFS